MHRRTFLKGVASSSIIGSQGAWAENSETQSRLALGYDNFAVRAMKWKAPELIKYAAELKCDTLFITDFGPFEKMTDSYLKDVRKQGEDAGVRILLGSWSICPSSGIHGGVPMSTCSLVSGRRRRWDLLHFVLFWELGMTVRRKEESRRGSPTR